MPAWEQEKPARPHKGKYRPGFPLDYVVVDTETTGLDRYSCVIEAAALRVRGGQVTAEFSTLIQPPRRELYRNGEWQEGFVEPFITQLTGITDTMLETAPLPETALPQLLDFLGDDPILGHNVHFDVNMLYDDLTRCLGRPLPNDYFDTLRLSRRLLPQLPHHRLGDVAAALGVPYLGAHRALGDCRITQACYLALRDLAHARYTEEELARLFDKKKKPPAPKPAAGPSHPFYGKRVAFAGELSTLTRRQAKELVQNAGGIPVDSASGGPADYLVVGGAALPVLRGKGATLLSEAAFLTLAKGGGDTSDPCFSRPAVL